MRQISHWSWPGFSLYNHPLYCYTISIEETKETPWPSCLGFTLLINIDTCHPVTMLHIWWHKNIWHLTVIKLLFMCFSLYAFFYWRDVGHHSLPVPVPVPVFFFFSKSFFAQGNLCPSHDQFGWEQSYTCTQTVSDFLCTVRCKNHAHWSDISAKIFCQDISAGFFLLEDEEWKVHYWQLHPEQF